MTRYLKPAPNLRRRVLYTKLALLSLVAFLTVATIVRLIDHHREVNSRDHWAQEVASDLQQVHNFGSTQYIFSSDYKLPPLVEFYLKDLLKESDVVWTVDHAPERVRYQMEVFFHDPDTECLSKLALLDEYIDDGDLLAGKLHIGFRGFVFEIDGPKSTRVDFSRLG